MATIKKLVDDLDGGTASRTVKWSFDNAQYIIDLSEKNIQGIFDGHITMEQLLRVSRPVTKRAYKKKDTSPTQHVEVDFEEEVTNDYTNN